MEINKVQNQSTFKAHLGQVDVKGIARLGRINNIDLKTPIDTFIENGLPHIGDSLTDISFLTGKESLFLVCKKLLIPESIIERLTGGIITIKESIIIRPEDFTQLSKKLDEAATTAYTKCMKSPKRKVFEDMELIRLSEKDSKATKHELRKKGVIVNT